MKNTLLIIIHIAAVNLALCQLPYFEIGETLTVISKSGANLRDSNAVESRKILTIPFGERVTAISTYEGFGIFEDREGGWIRIKYKNHEGYVFSGFMTQLNIPPLDLQQMDCGYLTWFENMILENVDTLVCSGNKQYKGYDGDGKDWKSSEWKIYTNETEIYHNSGYEHTNLIIETRLMNMNDILNLLEYYVDQIIKTCPDIYGYKVENKPEISITNPGQRISEITCPSMRFYSEQSLNKIIIIVGIFDL